ncbi:MAG TPA: hypothetical protein DCZ69_11165 [Syntrophobacteraceae bacterium]|nr:hypothetical protein [Syntrophobacteraceae bacterium]HBD08810.1 hypothetical protein [Syntrophobacteraceae bacterium]HBZ53882.1 hypothetical protein [Syntrophobacteraceae bacterium]
MSVEYRRIQKTMCWFWLIIIWCGFLAPACTSVRKAQSGQEPGQNDEAARRQWDEGMTAFQQGDYETAQRCFEVVSKRAVNEGIRRKALYALACTRLLLAQTEADYQAALHLWGLWNQLAPAKLSEEDPRMMGLLLPRLYSAELTKATPATPSSFQPASKSGGNQTVKVVRDRECERQLRESDQEVQRLKRQIRTLRLQIDALEAIHRKIQEKKKEVSTP